MTQVATSNQLKRFTRVVADIADFQAMKEFAPQDATTNPTLILKAVAKEEYASLADEAVAACQGQGLTGQALVNTISNELLARFGMGILKIVPGRVSTEVDVRLSYDTEGTVDKAREIIELIDPKE